MRRVEMVEVFWNEMKVGRLVSTRDGVCAFEYDAHYLQNGVSISPLDLLLKQGVKVAKYRPFGGNFGVFDDCLPDGWGLIVLDRYLKSKGISLTTLSIPERLSLVGSAGRGALEFRPDQSTYSLSETVDYNLLAAEAEKILKSSTYTGDIIETLYLQGGSPGGARPKIFTYADGREWLVKFRAQQDPEDVGQIEYEYSLLARRCGIDMPETRLFENKYFGVERFDRTGGEKLHVVSVAGLLNADYRVPCIDYLHIFQLCQLLTRNVQELWKVYRLMVFNFLIGNKDDHAKNFAFIVRNKEWYFAPAYDILAGDGINGYRTTSINDSIQPVKDDLLAVAQKAGLDKKKASSVYDEIADIVREVRN